MAVDVSSSRRAEVIEAVATPDRQRIIRCLTANARPAGELADELGMPHRALGAHLDELRELGVIEAERVDRWTYYRVRPEALAALADDLRAIERWARRPTLRSEQAFES